MIFLSGKFFKQTSRKADRALSAFFDPLADKAGGAVNLVMWLMLAILSTFALFFIFFTDFGYMSIIIPFVCLLLYLTMLTRNKFRNGNPWWYREKN